MKIMHVTDSYTQQGGVEQYILSVARLLTEHGHSNVILYTQQTALTIRNGAWPAYYIQINADMVAQIQRVLDIERPDVAYIHHISTPGLIDLLAGQLPAVAYVHGFTAVCPGLAKYFRRGDEVCARAFGWGCVPMHYLHHCSAARRPSTLVRLMRNTASLRQAYLRTSRLLVSTAYMQGLLAQNGFDPSRIALLPPHFLTAGQIPLYAPPEAPDTLLYAGRLEIEKGVPYLLRALSLLPDRVRLVVAGDGTLRQEYERMSSDMSLADRVEFLGWVDQEEMERCYRRCALVVIPSICPESFGKAGAEALTHGRPVVAFAVGGIPDWLDNGVTGLLARPANSIDLAAKLRELLEDTARQQAMGRAGIRSVAERYTARRHLSTLEAVLNDAIATHC